MKILNRNIALIVTVFSAILLTACDPEPVIPDQDIIFASYKVNYNEKDNKTAASVAFYQNEPSSQNQQKYELQHPSYVKYYDDQLLFDSEKRIYTKNFIGLIESNFEYSDYFGTAYFNEVEMVDSIDFDQLNDSIPIQQDLYFDVTGNQLQENEEIIVEVTSLSSGETYVFNNDTITTSTLYFISAQDLSVLGTGLTTFKGKRKFYSDNLDQANSTGGDLTIEYEIVDTVILY